MIMDMVEGWEKDLAVDGCGVDLSTAVLVL